MTNLNDIQHLTTAGNRGTLSEYIHGLRDLGVDWPEPPTEDILFQLAGWGHIQRLYGHLDLSTIAWSKVQMTAADLAAVKIPWDDGRERTAQCARDLDEMLRVYRNSRPDAWNSTWAVPPYVIEGALMERPNGGRCLMEGHSRMGILRGSLRRGDIEPKSLHQVWLAAAQP